MHVLRLKFKCKQYSSRRRVIVVPGSGTVNDVSCENNYWRCGIMNDSLFLLEETEFHSVNKHRKESVYFLKQIQYIRHLHQWTRQYVRSTSDFIWSTVLFYDKVTCLKSLDVLERWIFEYLWQSSSSTLCASLSGSEVNSFDQCSLQGDGEVIECVQDAGEGVYSSTVPQQSTFLVRPSCQGTLRQQGEPLREKPVPAKRNRSVVNNGPVNAWWSIGSKVS